MIRGGFHTFFLFFGVLCKSIFIIVPYQGIQCKLMKKMSMKSPIATSLLQNID
jgi:hypothetical protein